MCSAGSIGDMVEVDAARTALLLLDLQQGYLAQLAEPDQLLRRVGRIAAAARRGGLLVVHVTVAFRPGQPELSDRNRMFGRPEARGHMIAGSEEVRIASEVTPRADEP